MYESSSQYGRNSRGEDLSRRLFIGYPTSTFDQAPMEERSLRFAGKHLRRNTGPAHLVSCIQHAPSILQVPEKIGKWATRPSSTLIGHGADVRFFVFKNQLVFKGQQCPCPFCSNTHVGCFFFGQPSCEGCCGKMFRAIITADHSK